MEQGESFQVKLGKVYVKVLQRISSKSKEIERRSSYV
jgi:hypothetical protein